MGYGCHDIGGLWLAAAAAAARPEDAATGKRAGVAAAGTPQPQLAWAGAVHVRALLACGVAGYDQYY
jgi:hypothetical protein